MTEIDLTHTNPNEYELLVDQYAGLTRQLREYERLMRGPEELLALDRKRSALHDRIRPLAAERGITDVDLSFDLLTAEGNLMEFGVEAPVVRLPLPRRSYYNYKEHRMHSRPGEPTQILYAPGQAIPEEWHYSKDLVLLANDDKAKARWQKSPYYGIIFTWWQWDHGSTWSPPLHARRLKRLYNLSRDFMLNIYESNDQAGHQNYTPVYTFGVEVEQDRLQEIARAMSGQRDQYWLTEEEIADPYCQIYLIDENRGNLESTLWSAIYKDEKRNIIPAWRDYYDFLRIYDALRMKGIDPRNAQFSNENQLNQLWLIPLPVYANNIIDELRAAIEAAHTVSPHAAAEMQRIIDTYS